MPKRLECFLRLTSDVVIGPSDDGGYYLIGIRKPQPRLFEAIDWSTDRVRAQTLERAAEIGLGVHLLPGCYDVDDRRTLHRLCDDLLNPNAVEDPEIAPATREFLRDIVAREGRHRFWPAVSALTCTVKCDSVRGACRSSRGSGRPP